MLYSKLLLECADSFYGYGDLSAPVWFLGMEESGGDKESVQKRLATWAERGRQEVEDLAGYHEDMGTTGFTAGKNVKLQSTWAKLIHLQLAAEGRSADTGMLRSFQKTVWGRTGSRTCLLELMPLPKRSARSWKYNEWTDLPELWSRHLYFAHFAAKRASKLRKLFKEYRPKCVVFYGKSVDFSCHWPWIAGVRPQDWADAGKWQEVKHEGTHYMIAPHPTSFSSDNATWQEMGRRISGDVCVERPDGFDS